jgi:Helix-turn-helix domain
MSGVLEGYVGLADLARELRVCAHTIGRYTREPDGLPYLKVGKRKLFARDAVAEWLKRREVRPNPTRRAR